MDIGLHTTLLDANSIADPEVIALASRITPLQAAEFGKVWDLFAVRPAPFATDEFQVLTRAYTAPTFDWTAAGGTLWDNVATTAALPVSAATLGRLTVGDILLVDSEIVVIASIDRTGNTVTVYERGAGDTTGAAHGTSGTGQVIGNAHLEGTADATAMAEGTDKLINYCQIVQEVIDLSKEDSDQARKIGQTEPVLKAEAMERVMRDLARSAIFGTARAGTAAFPAMTRGLISHLFDVAGGIKTSVGGAFTETVLKNILDDVRKAGGSVNAIVLSVANKRLANSFVGADTITATRDERTGGKVLDGYLADGFGVVPFVVDIDFPDDKVVITNSRLLSKGWKVNDQLRFTPFTNVNPREKKELLAGKFGLAVEGVGKTHGLLYGIS